MWHVSYMPPDALGGLAHLIRILHYFLLLRLIQRIRLLLLFFYNFMLFYLTGFGFVLVPINCLPIGVRKRYADERIGTVLGRFHLHCDMW